MGRRTLMIVVFVLPIALVAGCALCGMAIVREANATFDPGGLEAIGFMGLAIVAYLIMSILCDATTTLLGFSSTMNRRHYTEKILGSDGNQSGNQDTTGNGEGVCD